MLILFFIYNCYEIYLGSFEDLFNIVGNFRVNIIIGDECDGVVVL